MPLKILALKQMYAYIIKVKTMPSTHIPHIAWEARSTPQKTKKSKFLVSSLIQDIHKWFTRWGVEAYVNLPIKKGKEEECMLNFDIKILNHLHHLWQTHAHQSKFEYYYKHVNPRYWENYKMSQPEAQVHICTPMTYMARKAITRMRTQSHMLKIEIGGRLKIDATKRICTSCTMQAIEDEAHVTLTCPTSYSC